MQMIIMLTVENWIAAPHREEYLGTRLGTQWGSSWVAHLTSYCTPHPLKWATFVTCFGPCAIRLVSIHAEIVQRIIRNLFWYELLHSSIVV